MTENKPNGRGGGGAVSPYLLWPKRTLDEAQRDHDRFHPKSPSAEQAEQAGQGGRDSDASKTDESTSGRGAEDEGRGRLKESSGD